MFGVSYLKLALVGGLSVAVIGVAGYVFYLKSSNTELEAKNAKLIGAVNAAEDIARNNAEQALRFKKMYEKQIKIVENANKELQVIKENSSALRERIRNANENDDGPIAPVLGNTLEQLREWGGYSDSPENTNSKTGDTRKPPNLREASQTP